MIRYQPANLCRKQLERLRPGTMHHSCKTPPSARHDRWFQHQFNGDGVKMRHDRHCKWNDVRRRPSCREIRGKYNTPAEVAGDRSPAHCDPDQFSEPRAKVCSENDKPCEVSGDNVSCLSPPRAGEANHGEHALFEL